MSRLEDDPILGPFCDTPEKKARWVRRLTLAYILWIIFVILGFVFFVAFYVL